MRHKNKWINILDIQDQGQLFNLFFHHFQRNPAVIPLQQISFFLFRVPLVDIQDFQGA